jgi:uncharacterized protein YndB with AHSA1/START domain
MASINVDQYVAHPPERVWGALTDPVRMAVWLMPNDFAPVVGHRFTFRTEPQPGFDGTVHCEVLEVVAPQRLRLSWRGGRLDTTVTWTLVPEGRGTRVFLEHAGFDPDDELQRYAFTALGGGWRSSVLPKLARVLDEA